MSHILICGAAGFTNLGDDAILWGMLTELRSVVGERAIRVAGGPQLGTVATPFGASVLSYDDRAELARAIEDADLVVLGGGGMLYDAEYQPSLARFLTEPPDRQWLYELAKIAAAARAAERPLMLYGMGAGPLLSKSGRRMARFVGELAQAVTVRDQSSAHLLAECGLSRPRVQVTADPAVSVEPGEGEAAEAFLTEAGIGAAPRPWIAFNLRPWYRFAGVEAGPAGAMERLIERAGAVVQRLTSHLRATVVLLPLQRLNDDDCKVLEAVRAAAGRPAGAVLVEPELPPPELVMMLARFDLMLGMRLHSLLLALDAGLPFVPLAYSPKVTDFARAVGAADYLHPVDELDPEAVFHSCRELLAHRARVQAALREHRRRMQDASRISAELAVELLEQGGAAVRTIAARPALATRPTSGLRVLMQIRPDYRTIPGGDVVQLEEMLPYLAEAGIRAEMSGEEAPDLSGWDLVHTINLDRPAEPYQHCLNALRQGKPIALSTVHADLTEFQEWGDSDYWELPEPGEGYPRPRPAPPPHPIEVRRRALLHLQRQAVIDWATVYLPNAEVNRDYLHQAFNLDLSRAVVVPNGARERFFQAEPELFIERYGLKDFVLCVGRVEKKKNQLSLIAAMRGSGLPLVIVGRPNPQEYFDLCRRYADENVLFIESLSEEELASAYAAAKVHALVSWLELPGLTTLEAAAAGCNIVSTNRGSPPEYLLDMAWYCDPRRVESVREAVLAAYHAPRSDRLSRHIRECYHWRRAAERTLEAYQLALALHQATPGSERQEALLAATQRYADWLTRRAADLEYQVNVREAQLVGYRELTTAYRLLEADRALVAKELEKAHQELRQVTSRRLYRWSAAAARAGWGLLRALRIRP